MPWPPSADAPLDDEALQHLHDLSIRHRELVLTSRMVGCFSCCRSYTPDHITEWTDHGQTAICPYCEVDSVLPDHEHDHLLLSLAPRVLTAMEQRWFAYGS
jgi:hypothetical protein